MIERIDDLADPRLDDYRCLTDGEAARGRGVFIAEGRLVVRVLLGSSRFRARSLLCTDAALESVRDALEAVPEAARPAVYVADLAVVSAASGFHVHRGCLAAVGRPGPTRVSDLLASIPPGPSTVVVLERVNNHDNIGGVFRNAAAFGASGVVLSPGCVDPLYRKAVRVSMGGVLRVPFARAGEDWPAELRRISASGWTVVALTPDADAEAIGVAAAALPAGARVALLLGSEGDGLSASALSAAARRVRIPIASGVDSLNVAAASAVGLHRLARPVIDGVH